MTDTNSNIRLKSEEEFLPLKDIRPNMMLSRDVCIEDGKVLLSKGAMLNSINYSKLKQYDIKTIYVKTMSINESHPVLTNEINTIEKQKVPMESRQEFKDFIGTYNEKKEVLKKAIISISDGDSIDLEALYTLTDGVMNKLKCKSDIFSFIGFIKDTSEHTFTHSSNVALLANLLAHWFELNENDKVNLTAGGILHDIGKTKTPPEILNKRGRLTDEEFKIMKAHTVEGYRILQNQDIPQEIKMVALMHHEKIDGTGYPLGIKDDKINKLARMVSIVDIFDAMTTNRVYRGKICPFDVIKTFEAKVYGELDTKYLLLFLRNIAYSYLGIWVNLSDNREAEVMFINQNNLSNPIVRTTDGAIIDLATDKTVRIVSVI